MPYVWINQGPSFVCVCVWVDFLARRFMDHHRADFMAHHEDDMEKLSTIADAIHVKENPLAVAFRSSKYNLKLSLYSFELFITFLNENRMAQLRKLVNQYIHIIGKFSVSFQRSFVIQSHIYARTSCSFPSSSSTL